jgi:CPA2 family monovalent cation:H+ antiporter-2
MSLCFPARREAFVKIAPLFRPGLDEEVKQAPLASSPRPDGHGIDREEVIEINVDPSSTNCTHLDRTYGVRPSANCREERARTGDDWLHLRICMTCGPVGCCDDSKNKYATRHYHETNHPIICSLERGEEWAWCYPDGIIL